ncbi:hypothetical protein [Litchfieldella rifensis]|uniref:Uncharacterized protein n=1 Tax=Litchfieldella rifensis TaxID=762643 RepID=A0ABV7LMQ1_9GAMM
MIAIISPLRSHLTGIRHPSPGVTRPSLVAILIVAFGWPLSQLGGSCTGALLSVAALTGISAAWLVTHRDSPWAWLDATSPADVLEGDLSTFSAAALATLGILLLLA